MEEVAKLNEEIKENPEDPHKIEEALKQLPIIAKKVPKEFTKLFNAIGESSIHAAEKEAAELLVELN